MVLDYKKLMEKIKIKQRKKFKKKSKTINLKLFENDTSSKNIQKKTGKI